MFEGLSEKLSGIFDQLTRRGALSEADVDAAMREVRRALLEHLQDHYSLYGEYTGVRSARKHIGWYVRTLPGGDDFREHMNTLETAAQQLAAVAAYLDGLAEQMERLTPRREACPELETTP